MTFQLHGAPHMLFMETLRMLHRHSEGLLARRCLRFPRRPGNGDDLYADDCVVGDEPVRETISATVLRCLALDLTRHGHRTAQAP